MAFRLRHRRLDRDLQRLVRKQLDDAIERLDPLDAEALSETVIHEARKSIKKVRAIVKLLKDPLGPWYSKANSRLRKAAARLGTIRDSDVAGETLQGLRSTVLTRSLESQVGKGLDRHRRVVRRHAAALARQALGLLQKTRKKLTSRIAGAVGSRAVRRGLVSTYEKSRAVMGDLQRSSGAAEFHQWRRRVKDHWYHVRLFEAIHPPFRKRAASLKRLETDLGDEHNLARLSELLFERPASFGGVESTTVAQGCIFERQQKLRDRALAVGRDLFAAKPKDFGDRVAAWWPG